MNNKECRIITNDLLISKLLRKWFHQFQVPIFHDFLSTNKDDSFQIEIGKMILIGFKKKLGIRKSELAKPCLDQLIMFRLQLPRAFWKGVEPKLLWLSVLSRPRNRNCK